MKYKAICRTVHRTNWGVLIPEGSAIEKYREKINNQFRNPQNDFIDIGWREPCFIKRIDIVFFQIEEIK